LLGGIMGRKTESLIKRADKLLACTIVALAFNSAWPVNAGEELSEQPNELSRFGLSEDCNNRVPRLKLVNETGDFKLWQSTIIREEKSAGRYVLTTKGVLCSLVIEQQYYSGELPPTLYVQQDVTVPPPRGIFVKGIKIPYFGDRRMMRKTVTQFLKKCQIVENRTTCKLRLQNWLADRTAYFSFRPPDLVKGQPVWNLTLVDGQIYWNGERIR
jgi:hypothetical protein